MLGCPIVLGDYSCYKSWTWDVPGVFATGNWGTHLYTEAYPGAYDIPGRSKVREGSLRLPWGLRDVADGNLAAGEVWVMGHGLKEVTVMLVRVLGDFGSGGEVGVGCCQHGDNFALCSWRIQDLSEALSRKAGGSFASQTTCFLWRLCDCIHCRVLPRSGFQPNRNGVATTRPWAALATSGFWKIGKRKEAWTVLALHCH